MPEDVVLPASYDYREQGRAPKIGNQGSLGTCWAFASLTALESTLLPDQERNIFCGSYVHAQSFSSGAGRRGRIHHVHGLSSFLGRTGVGVRRILMVMEFPQMA